MDLRMPLTPLMSEEKMTLRAKGNIPGDEHVMHTQIRVGRLTNQRTPMRLRRRRSGRSGSSPMGKPNWGRVSTTQPMRELIPAQSVSRISSRAKSYADCSACEYCTQSASTHMPAVAAQCHAQLAEAEQLSHHAGVGSTPAVVKAETGDGQRLLAADNHRVRQMEACPSSPCFHGAQPRDSLSQKDTSTRRRRLQTEDQLH